VPGVTQVEQEGKGRFSTGSVPAWQERALDRSLAGPRRRANAQLARLIAAAHELIDAQPGSAFTIQQLVNRAGMSTKTFYRHFASRDELLLAVEEDEMREVGDILERAVAAAGTPPARLWAFVEAYVGLGWRFPNPAAARARALEWQLLGAQYPEQTRRSRRPIEELLLRCLRDVAPDAPDDELRLLAVSVLSLLSGHIVAAVLGGAGTDAGPIARHAWRFCCQGLALDPAEGGAAAAAPPRA